ncbi:hypothetical protein BGZ76_005370, partial [Entomortierella beljakovae]
MFTAANNGYLVTLKKWKSIQQLVRIDSNHEEQLELLQMMLDHLFIMAMLWSPLKYTNKRKGNEDSFCANVVRLFLTSAFGQFPNVKLRVSMDCYRKSLGENNLVVAEVKSPSASQHELDDDYIKLPNLMKLALDHQIAQRYEDGTVVGLLVQGWKVLAFYLVLEHEAVYDLRTIGQF